MKRCVGVNTCESTGVFALDWSLWVVRDLSCYLVHHLVILSRPDPPRPTELSPHVAGPLDEKIKIRSTSLKLFMNDDPEDTTLSPARAQPSDGLNDQCLPCGWNAPAPR